MPDGQDRNPMARALGSGATRRPRAGESVYAGTATPDAHRRVSVDIPADLYRDAKVFAAQSGVTVKQIMVTGLAAELDRRRSA